MKTGIAKEVVEGMMIGQTKHPHPRQLEGTALVRSTHSYHFATIRFAIPRNAPFNRSVDPWDRPFDFGQPTARPIRFSSLWTIINNRDGKKPDRSRGADRDDDGVVLLDKGKEERWGKRSGLR